MIKTVRRLTALAIVFSLIASLSLVGIYGRSESPVDDEQLIKDYRTQIGVMEANAPPRGSSAEPEYRAALTSIRQKLRDLLVEKRGAHKSRIRNLEPLAANSPEITRTVTALRNELQTVESEITGLDRVLGAGALVAAPQVAPSPPAAPKPSPTPSDVQKAFEARVASLTASDLKSAAAPSVTETALAQPGCTADGHSTLPTASKLDTSICNLAFSVSGYKDQKILLQQDKGELFPILIAKLLKTKGADSYVAFVTEAQEARLDQQIGAGPSNSGTTSLVVKGGVPYMFGLAVENGAATQSQSDTTITYRVNPGGLINLFAKKGFISGFRENENDPFMKVLGKTSLGFTFDTSRGSQPGVFTGDRQQLSAFSARVEFVNERDPRLKKYEKTWEQFVATEQVKLGQEIWKTTLALTNLPTLTSDETFKDPALEAWLRQTNLELAAVASTLSGPERVNQMAVILRARADLLPVKDVSDETVAAITGFARQFMAYTAAKNALLKQIAKGKIFTLEYTNTRGVNAPDLSNINFIAATGMGARIDLTANGSFTFYNKQPLAVTPGGPRPGRIRDFQFAGQVAIPFKVGDGQFDFWFSGRYERLLENASTLAGTTVPGTKGDIAVGQVGLNIPIKSLGIKFPVSVTFANRTELIKEKEVRGNIGFTFNWDTLFSKLKPF